MASITVIISVYSNQTLFKSVADKCTRRNGRRETTTAKHHLVAALVVHRLHHAERGAS